MKIDKGRLCSFILLAEQRGKAVLFCPECMKFCSLFTVEQFAKVKGNVHRICSGRRRENLVWYLFPRKYRHGIRKTTLLFIRYAGAQARFYLIGAPLATQAEIDQRLDGCRRCDKYENEGCKLCGCNVNNRRSNLANKLAMRNARCPKGSGKYVRLGPPVWIEIECWQVRVWRTLAADCRAARSLYLRALARVAGRITKS